MITLLLGDVWDAVDSGHTKKIGVKATQGRDCSVQMKREQLCRLLSFSPLFRGLWDLFVHSQAVDTRRNEREGPCDGSIHGGVDRRCLELAPVRSCGTTEKTLAFEPFSLQAPISRSAKYLFDRLNGLKVLILQSGDIQAFANLNRLQFTKRLIHCRKRYRHEAFYRKHIWSCLNSQQLLVAALSRLVCCRHCLNGPPGSKNREQASDKCLKVAHENSNWVRFRAPQNHVSHGSGDGAKRHQEQHASDRHSIKSYLDALLHNRITTVLILQGRAS